MHLLKNRLNANFEPEKINFEPFGLGWENSINLTAASSPSQKLFDCVHKFEKLLSVMKIIIKTHKEV